MAVWNQLLRWAPEIITLSRELLQRSRGPGEPANEFVRPEDHLDLAARVATLEENERRQAELAQRMAQQQVELARAVLTLHRRERYLIGAIVLVAALAVWALLR